MRDAPLRMPARDATSTSVSASVSKSVSALTFFDVSPSFRLRALLKYLITGFIRISAIKLPSVLTGVLAYAS